MNAAAALIQTMHGQGLSLPRKAPPIPVCHPALGVIASITPGKGLLTHGLGWRQFEALLRDDERYRRNPRKAFSEMGAISTYDGIITARGSGLYEDALYAKTTAVGGVSTVWYSFFRTAGIPPTISPSNIPGGSVMNRASTGAFALANPGGARKKYLLSASMTCSSVSGYSLFWVVDLLVAAANISGSVNTLQTVNTSALTRYTNGEGVYCVLCVTTTLGGTAANLTVTYTNQAGTGSRSVSGMAMTTAAAASRLQPSVVSVVPYFTLQAGDYGVRSVESVQLSASMTAGVLDIYLFRPIMAIPVIAANTIIERDSTLQIEGLTELVLGSDSAIGCLGFFGLTGGTSTATLSSFVRTCEG